MGCEDCYYWRAASSGKRGTGLKFCWYALDNHACRLQPAERCTYKITVKEVETLGKIDEAEARRLHAEGKNDREIAEVFGATPSGVSFWRHKRGLPANAERIGTKKEVKEVPAVLKITSIDALPAEMAEKIRAAMPQAVETPVVSQQLTDKQISFSVNSVEVNKLVYLPDRYDPLIYDAFDLAIAKTYETGGQPGQSWRQLLAAVERHIQSLAGYLEITDEAMRCAVELAAQAAVEEVLRA